MCTLRSLHVLILSLPFTQQQPRAAGCPAPREGRGVFGKERPWSLGDQERVSCRELIRGRRSWSDLLARELKGPDSKVQPQPLPPGTKARD